MNLFVAARRINESSIDIVSAAANIVSRFEKNYHGETRRFVCSLQLFVIVIII